MSAWDDFKRELRNLWEILTTGEPLPDEESREEEIQETDEESGGFFDEIGDALAGRESPREPPDDFPDYAENFGTGATTYPYEAGDGPYPDNWGAAEIKFWDTQFDRHIFDSYEHMERAQDLFYDGYMAKDDEISHEDRVQARDDFLDWTYFDAIDWDAFAEYYSETT